MKLYASLMLLVFSSSVSADLPLTVENLLSDKGKWRLRSSLTYANSERKGIDASNPLLVQTGESTFVTIPTIIGENVTNTDALVTTIGLGYGITAKDELYARASSLSVNSRSLNVTGLATSNSTSQFSDAWLGVNHKFRNNVDKAALLGFAELQLAERQSDGSTVSGKSWVIGATAYQTYDPVVLSLTGAIQVNTTREVSNTNYKPGNVISLTPSVGFAVNDKVTLTTGLRWWLRQAATRDNITEGINQTQTALNLGLGYALGKRDTLSFKVRPQVSGEGDVQISLNWNHRMGQY